MREELGFITTNSMMEGTATVTARLAVEEEKPQDMTVTERVVPAPQAGLGLVTEVPVGPEASLATERLARHPGVAAEVLESH